MKKTILTLNFALLLACFAHSQLSGTYYIPYVNGVPSFQSIQAAVNDLNTFGVSGSVTFLVEPGYVESVTAPILLTATGSEAMPIVFQKNGSGINPSITRTDNGSIATNVVDGQGDAVIIIQGSDYVTFDGIDVTATWPNIEYGYYLRKVSGNDACKNVTIKNARIQMNKSNSPYVCGIFSSNNNDWTSFYTVTVTAPGGRTENLVITGNTVENVHSGIRIIGYNHTSSPYDLLDSNNFVGQSGEGNTVRNFGGASTTQKSYGIYVAYQSSANISFNNIDNVAGGGTPSKKELGGIYAAGANGGRYFVINNNLIKMSQQSSERIYWIYTAQNCDSIKINNNTFQVGQFSTKTVASYMIYCQSATPFITVNGNQSDPFPNMKEESGDLYGFYCAPNNGPTHGVATIANNIFTGIKMPGGNFWGIHHAGSLNQQVFIQNNTISGLINNGGTSTTYPTSIGILQGKGAAGSAISGNIIENWSGGSHFIGISAGNPASSGVSLYNNTIRNLISTRTNTGGNWLYVYGILTSYGNPCNIYKNRVYNLEANKINANVYGIIVGNSSTNDVHNIYNNFVSDLRTPKTDGYQPPPLVGIYVQYGTTVNVFYNTVYLNATSNGFSFGSAAIYAAGIPGTTQDFRNNVLVNLSVPNGWGKTVAYQRNNDLLDMYSMNSDANCLYAGPVEDATHAVFYDQTNVYHIDAFKTRVGPVRDAHSFRELPPFVNGITAPFDLHMLTTVPTLCESGGHAVTSPLVISDDIDGNPRSATPDVGADEFTGIHGLEISASVTQNICNGTATGAINLTVTGGVPPYAFLWSNAATTEDISLLAAGTYSVTVTDAVAGTIVGSWTVTEPGAISLSATTTPESCPGASDGSIDLTVNGGTPDFTFLWSNGATTQNISGVPAGDYQATVTDQNTCVTNASWTIPIISPVCQNITVSGTIDTTACFNATDTLTVAGNGSTFVVQPTGSATFIAGATIFYLPGTTVQQGGYMLGKITSAVGPFCETPPPALTAVKTGNDELPLTAEHSFFTLYPNPTNNSFTLTLKDDRVFCDVKVTVYNMSGEKVLNENMNGKKKHKFSFSGMPAGLYIVKVLAEDHAETLKLVKL